MTLILDKDSPDLMNKCSEFLKSGKIISFPTETVYAVAVDAYNDKALNDLYDLKNRPTDKPFQIMCLSIDDAFEIGEFSEQAKKIAQKFFPGELTIIVPAKKLPSKYINRSNNTLAIRVPRHDLSLNIIKNFGRAIATSSANISGYDCARSAEEIQEIFGDKLSLIISEKQPLNSGTPSTIIDTTSKKIKILREGIITKNDLLSTI